MPLIADSIFDSGLTTIASTTVRVDICYTQEPTTYAEATSTYSCGNKTGVTTSAITNGATDGRRVTVSAITDGDVTSSQTAAFWAVTNGTNTLYAAGPISPTQLVGSGNKFTLDAIDITLRDATAV